jgi:hypothetical protein
MVLLLGMVNAQQDAQFTHVQSININPAYAGSRQSMNILPAPPWVG